MTLDEAIESLRDLNEEVPKPMRLPTTDEVSAVEAELGVKFHPDLRKYLLEASDVVFGTREPVTITEPDSHTYLPAVCESAWEECSVPKNLIPICEDNGDYYCMDQKGAIRFWSQDGASEEKWLNLAAWIEEVWIGESE